MSNHRVLVELVDSENEDYRLTEQLFWRFPYIDASVLKKQINQRIFRNVITADVEVLDKRTIILSKQDSKSMLPINSTIRRMTFDTVGHVSDPYMRAEISGLMNQLLLHHQNCGLIIFEINRESNLRFLCTLFITEVEQRMNLSNTQMLYIKLECYDVRKYDLVNVFGRLKLRMQERNPKMRSVTLKNTVELRKWLYLEYAQIWNSRQGHEWLDIDIMDADTKRNLVKFFTNVSEKKRIPRRSMVIDCIKEFFKGEEKWSTLLVFHVPKRQSDATDVDDLLKIAKAAYTGIKVMEQKSNPFGPFNPQRISHAYHP